MSLDAVIRLGERVLCDDGDAWALVRAVLFDPDTGVLDRLVLEPPHMVAQGQFASAGQLSFDDGVLSFNGFRAIFDMNAQAEVEEWVPSRNRGVDVITGRLVPVEGLTTLEDTTPVLDRDGDAIGTVAGVAVRGPLDIDRFVVRLDGLVRHREVAVSRRSEVAGVDGTGLRLTVGYDELHGRPRL